MARKVQFLALALVVLSVLAVMAQSEVQPTSSQPQAVQAVDTQVAAVQPDQPLDEPTQATSKTPRSMTSFLAPPSTEWLDQYREESYRDSQVYFNILGLQYRMSIQQRQIKELEARLKSLEGQITTQAIPPAPVVDGAADSIK
jgi:hypothetical protein